MTALLTEVMLFGGYTGSGYFVRLIRRKSGTRAKVTWHRGALERTDAPTGALLDDATTPAQHGARQRPVPKPWPQLARPEPAEG